MSMTLWLLSLFGRISMPLPPDNRLVRRRLAPRSFPSSAREASRRSCQALKTARMDLIGPGSKGASREASTGQVLRYDGSSCPASSAALFGSVRLENCRHGPSVDKRAHFPVAVVEHHMRDAEQAEDVGMQLHL